MRLRKRANWPILVYRYWVDPEYQTWEQLPGPIQQEAEAMRALWNHLVSAFEQRQVAYYQACKASAAEVSTPVQETLSTAIATRKPSALALRQIQQTFLRTTEEVNKASPVTWGNKQFVTTQFFAALTRFFKKQGEPPRQRNGEFREVHFQHRFTEGGLPVERIFGHSQRLCLTPVNPEAFSSALSQRQQKRLARTSGTFQVNRCPVRLHTILHRPLPPGAYLKVAALIGKRTVQSGYHRDGMSGHSTPSRWDWSLQLTLEVLPQQHAVHKQRTTAALQIRCELLDEQCVSFAIVTDPTGREETLFLPESLLASWHHKRWLQKQADQLLKATKQQLQEVSLAEQSPSIQQRLAHLQAASAPGLWRLLHVLEKEGSGTTALQILRRWASYSTKLLREARGVEQHYLGHRDWFYHNLALKLCQRYQQLVVTAPEAGTTYSHELPLAAPVADRVRLYHQFTAPARFLSFLRQAAGKTGTIVKEEVRLTTHRTLTAEKIIRSQTQFSGDKAETIAQSPLEQ